MQGVFPGTPDARKQHLTVGSLREEGLQGGATHNTSMPMLPRDPVVAGYPIVSTTQPFEAASIIKRLPKTLLTAAFVPRATQGGYVVPAPQSLFTVLVDPAGVPPGLCGNPLQSPVILLLGAVVPVYLNPKIPCF